MLSIFGFVHNIMFSHNGAGSVEWYYV